MTTELSIKKQVDRSHYDFTRYMSKERWISVWHQLDEVIRLQPSSVLEIGPGTGIFKSAGSAFGLNIQTLDIDEELSPDYIGRADSIPLPNESFDVVCAFQVLEHMPFDISMAALAEMCRVSRKAVVISLPQAGRTWPNTIALPYIRKIQFILRNPFRRPHAHHFDGEHHWEIGKKGYSIDQIMDAMRMATPFCKDIKTNRVHENPYHRFFVIYL